MRFNDLIDTVLSCAPQGASAPVTRWRQCVDLLAQFDRYSPRETAPRLEPEVSDRILEVLRSCAPRLTIAQRLASVVELGSRIESPQLVRLFAADHSAVCSATMARAMLDEAVWADLIPTLGPLARSVLRRRKDLDARVMAMLAQFGPVDMSLPYVAPPPPAVALAAPSPPPESRSDIARIVERIERFTSRRSREANPADPSCATDPDDLADAREGQGFAFETDALGVIHKVEGVPCVSVEGLSIAVATQGGRSGPDGQMLGAFRRRAAFRDLRYLIGEGALYGEWRLSAEPLFDAGNGRFTGYRGTARRPTPAERPIAGQLGAGAAESSVTPDSTRQLVHELRTPLNAIQGFAEIIEQQLMGPVPPPYRAMARRILEDATRLIGLFDDLDLASRIARGDERSTKSQVDLPDMVAAALDRQYAPTSRADGQPHRAIVLRQTGSVPPVAVDRVQAERMIAHLVRIIGAALAPSEQAGATLASDRHAVRLVLERPAALRGLDETILLDPSSPLEHEEPDGPPLGIAFGLRLVRSLASHSGGRLDIAAGHFALCLPAVEQARDEGRSL